MIEDTNSFSFASEIDDINYYARMHNILTIGFSEGPQSNEIKLSHSEIVGFESQYILAYVIKKTEKLYNEIHDNSAKKKGHISFRSFFPKYYLIANILENLLTRVNKSK
jgi:hypothetical protein